MFEQAFRNIDDALRKEAGCTTELDYTEQTSWLLFLKYLDGLEEDKAAEAELHGKAYDYILAKPYRWDTWAAPKKADGKTIDDKKAMGSDDLTDFVDDSLFPYLQKFKQSATSANTIEYKIGEIFSEIKNRIHSGSNLREIINEIDALRFRSQTEKHELSQPKQKDSAKSWTIDVQSLDPATFDLSVKNPSAGEAIAHRTPQEIMDEIAALDAESAEVLSKIRELL